MICTSCVREKPPESRKACIDIDIAYNQNLKKLDRALLVSGRTVQYYIILPSAVLNTDVMRHYFSLSVGVRHAEFDTGRRACLPYATGGVATKYRHGEVDDTQFRASPPRCY